MGKTMGGHTCPRCGLYAYVTLESFSAETPPLAYLNKVLEFVQLSHDTSCREDK